MRTREPFPVAENKATDAHKRLDQEPQQERAAGHGDRVPLASIGQAGTTPLPGIQSGSHKAALFSGNAFAAHSILQLQRRYGNHHVQKLLKPHSSRPEGIGPERAPDAGSEDPGSDPQNEQPFRAQPEGIRVQAANATPAIQRLSVPFFSDYEFDFSIEGVKTAGNLALGKAKEGAVWVKDQVVAAGKWIAERITSLINAGIEWLTDKFKEVEAFAKSSFADIQTAVRSALNWITNPLDVLKTALGVMDAGMFAAAWRALTTGANAASRAIRAAVDAVLSFGGGLWKTISGHIDSLFDTVGDLLDSRAFGVLPDFIKDPVRGLYKRIRDLWTKVRDFWTDLWKRLTTFVKGLLESIDAFVRKVASYAIDTVIETVRKLKEVWDFVKRLVTDPESVIKPILASIASKINAEAPGKAREVARQKATEAWSSSESSRSSSRTVVHRSPDGAAATRSRATRDEVNSNVERELSAQWATLDIPTMLWDAVVTMFYPPALIRGIGHELSELWNNDWAAAVDSLFAPRSIFDDFAGFWHDVWSNFLILLEFPLAFFRRMISILTLLMGYITLLLILIGVVGGAIFGGGLPGALAGLAAAAELAWAIGELLFVSFLIVESATALKAFLDLYTARQTQQQKKRDYLRIAASTIGIGVAIVIAILFVLLGALVRGIVGRIRGGGPRELPPGRPEPKQLGPGSETPPETPKTETPKPAEPPKEEPKPVEPPKEEPKPVEPPKEEPKPVEPPKEEPKPVEPPKEEPKPVEPPKEEPKPVEPPKEEPKPAEPPKEEPKPSEPPKEEPKPRPPKERPKKPPKQEPAPSKPLNEMTLEELVQEGNKELRTDETKAQAGERVKRAKAEAQSRGYCFVAGTRVQTADGPKPVEALVPGQIVCGRAECDESVRHYKIAEVVRGAASMLYRVEVDGHLVLCATGSHPFFVAGKGWTRARDLAAGDQLLALDRESVAVTNVSRERLAGKVATFNLHVEEAHNYFVGDGPSVLVHNGPVTDPALQGPLIWGLDRDGPRVRGPTPGEAGDVDGASGWRSNSLDEAGKLMGVRAARTNGEHAAITEAQLASEGLVAIDTPGKGRGPLRDAGFKHVSIRPASNRDPNVALTETEMAEVNAKLERIKPEVVNRPADFLCR